MKSFYLFYYIRGQSLEKLILNTNIRIDKQWFQLKMIVRQQYCLIVTYLINENFRNRH